MAVDQYAAFGLNDEQRAEAQRIVERLGPLFEEELLRMACFLASKGDRELFGKTEFYLRDQVHRLGAKTLEAAAEERQKKGGIRGC
jgi:hypothetical protein